MKEPIEQDFAGKKMRAVGPYLFAMPPNASDHEVYIEVLKKVLSPGWYEHELKKPEAEQHTIARWYQSFCAFQKEQSTPQNKSGSTFTALPTGDVLSFLSVGYDLYCLVHTMNLPDDLLTRLKDMQEFQGARYEIAVAAIFARLDYKIAYNKPDPNKKTCEFIVTNPETGETFGVEAKSRRRPGVLHEPGEKDPNPTKTGVVRKINEAINQRPADIPFVIFVDMNLPASEVPPQESPLMRDLKMGIENEGLNSPENLCKYTMLVVTNQAYYYEGKGSLEDKKYATFISVLPKHSAFPFKRHSTVGDILQEAEHLGEIPERKDPEHKKRLLQRVLDKIGWIQKTNLLMSEHKKPDFPPTITALLTCQEIEMKQSLLTLHNIGHTLFSQTGKGTVNLRIYCEGHWFTPGKVKITLKVTDSDGKVVSGPPAFEATVSENGIFETKLLLDNHIPFKAGLYFITATIENGPTATTELRMIT